MAKYDASTQVGVIFLCTASGFARVNANKFIPIYGGVVDSDGHSILQPPNPMLRTVPPDAFSAPFYLNISHPLRVRVVHVFLGSFSTLRSTVLPVLPPPPIGMQGCMFDSTSSGPSVIRLHPDSELEFWQFHRRYHRDRPAIGVATIEGGGSNGGASGDGGALRGDVAGAFGVGGSSGGASGGGVVAMDGTQYLLPNGEWERGVAPWNRIGQF